MKDERRASILFVCLGNICRSPMAEFVMKKLIADAGLEQRITVASAATSNWEIGNDIHTGSQGVMRRHGIPFEKRQARLITRKDYDVYDYLIGMEQENLWDMKRILGGDPEEKMRLLLSFTGKDRDIADPWYTGDFESTYADVLEGCEALLEHLKQELD